MIDDVHFAAAILIQLAAAAILLRRTPIPLGWDAPILYAGLPAILGWSCRRATAARRVKQ